MTEATSETRIRLWTPEGFREDGWIHAEDASALAGNTRVILPLHAYLGLDPEQRKAAGKRLGVQLQPGDQLDAILDRLGELSLVALAFQPSMTAAPSPKRSFCAAAMASKAPCARRARC